MKTGEEIMKSIKLVCLLLAVLLLAGCVTRIGGPVEKPDGQKLPSVPGGETETTAAPQETTAPAPTETVKPCEHEWEPHPIRPHTATCVKAGEEFFLCKLCKAEKSEEKAAVGHYWQNYSYIAGDCTTGVTHRQLCVTCGAERNHTSELAQHTPDWENPGRVVAATCTDDGFRYAYCTVCGARAMETLPATGHSYADGKCTGCGEAATAP